MSEIGLSLHELDTPFLWVDLDRLQQNIDQLTNHFHSAGVAWRPHTKGIKTPAIAHMLIRAGAIGITCAKVGEAEVMVAAGIRDILIANQVVGPHKYRRLANLCRQADVKIAVDSTATLNALGEAALAQDVEIGVLVEVDTGMHRAGVQPADVLALVEAIDKVPGIRFEGLMSWEGHALASTDRLQAAQTSIELLLGCVDECRAAGYRVNIVSCGGSGTADVTPFIQGVTEVQAGGAIFNDVTYAGWNVQTEPAIFVRSVVTSRPAPTRIIVDAGFKTMPAWLNPPKPLGIEHVAKVATSAEHGIVTLSQPNDAIAVGDQVDFMLGYGDATVFLHDQIYGVRNGVVECIWPVAARGHLR